MEAELIELSLQIFFSPDTVFGFLHFAQTGLELVWITLVAATAAASH
jgi:hypothetical protein